MNKKVGGIESRYMTKARLRVTEIKESNDIWITLKSTITGWLMGRTLVHTPEDQEPYLPTEQFRGPTRRAKSPVGTTTKEFKKLDFGWPDAWKYDHSESKMQEAWHQGPETRKMIHFTFNSSEIRYRTPYRVSHHG